VRQRARGAETFTKRENGINRKEQVTSYFNHVSQRARGAETFKKERTK